MKGYHLKLNCKICDNKRIDDIKYIRTILLRLIDKIGMELLTTPVLVRAKKGEPDGITGFIVITTSHISIHTFTKENMFFLDIFSCKKFDYDKASDFIIDAFSVKNCFRNMEIRE